jgi:hypothetical protein
MATMDNQKPKLDLSVNIEIETELPAEPIFDAGLTSQPEAHKPGVSAEFEIASPQLKLRVEAPEFKSESHIGQTVVLSSSQRQLGIELEETGGNLEKPLDDHTQAGSKRAIKSSRYDRTALMMAIFWSTCLLFLSVGIICELMARSGVNPTKAS